MRDKQLEQYLKNKEKLSNLSAEKDEETIKDLSQQIIKLGRKPSLEKVDQKTLIKNLTNKFDAVQFVKVGSEIIGGKGGGGRKDFAQAGGQDQSKIEEAFEKLKGLV